MRRALPWLGLAALLAAFLGYLASLRLGDNFGRFHDDTLYLSSAQALAQGRGYILPSVPGTPPQGKYPILYSWLLSWVWKWNPAFPANVGPVVWITAVFACWFLVAAFASLREMGDAAALALVALCAFQPHFLFVSGSVLSDVPFMALALTAAVAGDRAFREDQSPGIPYVVAAGILAGLSVMTRSVGVAVIAGLVACAIYRRTYRYAALFCLVAVPFLLSGMLRAQAPPPVGEPGWRQTWLFYTGYLGYFRMSIPNLEVYWGMLAATWNELLQTPATYCLFPPSEGSQLGAAFEATLTVGILAGVVRWARRHAWKPLHFVFLFYTAMLLLWSPQTDRYLLLFLPMFYGGLWAEGKHLFGLLVKNLQPARPLGQRALAALVMAGLLTVGGFAAEHYVRGFRPQLREQPREWAALAVEKAQLYDWIRREAESQDRFVAYEDVNVYLFTGRQALRPIVFSAGALYPRNQKVLDAELDHLTDVARHIGARYWVVTPDDYPVQNGREAIQSRIAQLTAALPVAFRSSNRRVQVVDLSGLQPPHTPGLAY